MADIFISYAKTDRPLALNLAAMLEAEGWTIWWDTSLAIGDDFRNEIMTELGRARAVVVIWTDASIKSDWVRSEAGRAQADRKLIPVKLEHLTYKDLPPPFDVLHTEDASEHDKIRAAVVAQLAKPVVEPSAVALLTKGFKYELLTWVGIVGGALTLFTNLGAVLKLADWARLLVQGWKEWTHTFWVWAFGWLGIHLGPGWTPVLSFLSFGSLLAIGQAIKFNTQPIADKDQGNSFRLISWRTLLTVIAMFVMYELIDLWADRYYSGDFDYYSALGVIAVTISPIVLCARHRLHAAISVGLILTFFIILAFDPLRELGRPGNPDLDVVGAITLVLICIFPLILLSVAPAKAISRRLIFLAIGLILLVALNELSKLAPKLHEWGL